MDLFPARTHNAMREINHQPTLPSAAVERALYITAHHAAAETFRLTGPAQCHTYTGQQFIQAERFSQVVICPLVESPDLHLFFVARRQDDNGLAAPFAQPSQQL